MNGSITPVLSGAVAMASFVAALFFLKYWRQTRDSFFLLFALAFGIEALSRLVLAIARVSDESEPLYYIPRLVAFSLIILAIVLKNRPQNR
jgi:uncharacterized membrane protein HdeD (DUF308 family)